MFKFLFGGKSNTPKVTIETDRARFARLVAELNEMIDGLSLKPRVTFDPESGHILPDTPEQFADEALALPAPSVPLAEDAQEPASVAEPEPVEVVVPSVPKPPVPNPPKPHTPST